MEVKMKQLKITEMCRLCLSRDMTMADVFLFSSELGNKIADIIMECAPVQITKHDNMPTSICRLCFTQLKKFHRFQMQVVQSDKTLQRYLQQFKAEWALEEPSNNSVSQNYNADVITKREPFEICGKFGNFFSNQEVLVNFSAVNKTNDEIFLKSEIKDEPMDDNSIIPAECADNTTESLSKGECTDISYEDSVIEICDTKVDVNTSEIFEYSLKFENGMTEKIPLKSEETRNTRPEETDSSLLPENVKDVESLRSNKDRNDCKNKFQNFSKKFHVNEKLHQCDICKMSFKMSGNLKRHKLIHTEEKPHQCDICKMSFREPGNLKKHNLIHTGEKSHQCDICKMSFRQSCNLKRHKLIHTGEKPHQCDICKMSFIEPSNLKKHNLIHTGEKPHQCDICKMSFIEPGNLKKHNLIHTGEKPHQCDICKMCFRLLGSLTRHKLIHTGEKPHQCDICKMCFRRADHLKSHKLKHTE